LQWVRVTICGLSVIERISRGIRAGLENGSPWLAVVAGLAFGLPSLYMVAAIAAMLVAGVGLNTQVAALVVFSLLAFVQAVVPLVGFLVAPNATRAGLDTFHAWLSAHERLVVATLATGTGTYLVIKGITRL
jgi:heme/copper-type cytochrome/quinol oxidase subunit 4